MPFPNELMIGTQAAGVNAMVAISSLGEGTYASAIQEGSFTVDPVSYSQTIVLADGTEIEQGWLRASWHINGLRDEQHTAVIAYKTAHSNYVYIRTLDNDGKSYRNFLAKAIWPIQPNRGDAMAVEAGAVFDFEIKFIQLIEQAE